MRNRKHWLLFCWGDWRSRCRWHSLCHNGRHGLGAGWWHGHKRLGGGLGRDGGRDRRRWGRCRCRCRRSRLNSVWKVMQLQRGRRGAELGKGLGARGRSQLGHGGARGGGRRRGRGRGHNSIGGHQDLRLYCL